MEYLREPEKIPPPKTRVAIDLETEVNHKVFQELKEIQQRAQGKTKVASAVEAYEYRDGMPYSIFFYGCNIHVSDSFGDTHAERMAIDHALKEYCYPVSVYVTSTSEDEKVMLCASCRHYISEINENCNIIVFNPDGTIKQTSTIMEMYPFSKDVKEKNQRFFERYFKGRPNVE